MNGAPPRPLNIPEVQDLAILQAQMLRPAKNVNVDGSFELGWGTMLLCSGLIPFINAALPKSFWMSAWTAWMSYLPLVCMAFAPYAVPRMIKRFITWPRTGYVANLNDVKLIQLVMIMGFGSALGLGLTLPFLLVSEIREFMSQAGSHSEIRRITLHGIELLVCATLVVYLGRKVISRRRPMPAAYDAAFINSGLGQTGVGRKRLRVIKSTLLLMFLGFPVLMGVVVFGLMYLSKTMMHRAEIHWPQMGVLIFIAATNSTLYLMGNGIRFKQHRWKWLVLALMLIGTPMMPSVVPYVSLRPELMPILELVPPPVMLFLGLVWFFSGGLTLLLFIRHNPLPGAETA